MPTVAPPKAVVSFNALDLERDMVHLGWEFQSDPTTAAPDYFVVQMIARKDAPWETVAKPSGQLRYVVL